VTFINGVSDMGALIVERRMARRNVEMHVEERERRAQQLAFFGGDREALEQLTLRYPVLEIR
jgi:hypothetical protein